MKICKSAAVAVATNSVGSFIYFLFCILIGFHISIRCLCGSVLILLPIYCVSYRSFPSLLCTRDEWIIAQNANTLAEWNAHSHRSQRSHSVCLSFPLSLHFAFAKNFEYLHSKWMHSHITLNVLFILLPFSWMTRLQ